MESLHQANRMDFISIPILFLTPRNPQMIVFFPVHPSSTGNRGKRTPTRYSIWFLFCKEDEFKTHDSTVSVPFLPQHPLRVALSLAETLLHISSYQSVLSPPPLLFYFFAHFSSGSREMAAVVESLQNISLSI